MTLLGLTDHLEGAAGGESADVYAEVAALVEAADAVGFDYAWFAEHHAYAHRGHCPSPLLFALHLAGRTKRVRLGTAVTCLNLHHPLAVAEQCAVADTLMAGRSAFGFGSGSTPNEAALFGRTPADEAERHRQFEAGLRLLKSAWAGDVDGSIGGPVGVPPHRPLPVAPGLASRAWVAVNSVGAARVAGATGFNVLFSHLRTPAQYAEYATAYRSAGGTGLLAANRPVHVAADDVSAFARIEPALRLLWRRFRHEGKIPADAAEPCDPRLLCGHPINFIVGGAETVAREIAALQAACTFEVLNVEVRWEGLGAEAATDCVRRLGRDVQPLIG